MLTETEISAPLIQTADKDHFSNMKRHLITLFQLQKLWSFESNARRIIYNEMRKESIEVKSEHSFGKPRKNHHHFTQNRIH
jgi:hypothetical protein